MQSKIIQVLKIVNWAYETNHQVEKNCNFYIWHTRSDFIGKINWSKHQYHEYGVDVWRGAKFKRMRKLHSITQHSTCAKRLHCTIMRGPSREPNFISTTIFSKIRTGKFNHLIQFRFYECNACMCSTNTNTPTTKISFNTQNNNKIKATSIQKPIKHPTIESTLIIT